MTPYGVMNSQKPIRLHMGGLILGVNILNRLVCFFKLFPMGCKELNATSGDFRTLVVTCVCSPSDHCPLTPTVFDRVVGWMLPGELSSLVPLCRHIDCHVFTFVFCVCGTL